MTHSSEVVNVNEKSGPTEMRAGVMFSLKRNPTYLYALLHGQDWLLELCSRQCTETRVEKKIRQTFAVTNSIEFKDVITSMYKCSRGGGGKEKLNKTAESTNS